MEIEMEFSVSDIMHDVMNETWLAGRSRGGDREAVYRMQAGDETAVEKKLLESLDANMEGLKAALPFYIRSGVRDKDRVRVALEVSERFNPAYKEALSMAMGRYVTNRMLFEWYRTARPEEADTFYKEAGECLRSMQAMFLKLPPQKP